MSLPGPPTKKSLPRPPSSESLTSHLNSVEAPITHDSNLTGTSSKRIRIITKYFPDLDTAQGFYIPDRAISKLHLLDLVRVRICIIGEISSIEGLDRQLVFCPVNAEHQVIRVALECHIAGQNVVIQSDDVPIQDSRSRIIVDDRVLPIPSPKNIGDIGTNVAPKKNEGDADQGVVASAPIEHHGAFEDVV